MPYQAAPFLRRLAARLIDLAVCLALTFLIALPMSLPVVLTAMAIGETHENVVYSVGAWLCYFAAYIGLEVFLLVRRDGQTLGKGLLGLQVVPADAWARPGLGLRQAAVRMLIIFLPFFFMSVAGSNPDSSVLNALALIGFGIFAVSCVLAMVTENGRRAVHDLATGTRVVRAATRRVEVKKDLLMVLPGRVDLSKRRLDGSSR
ncbi:RDD family protein [Nocardia salmonicida]|uniref:RDD family protein n=1 Tax=Nocardia salmonicida TaxID=53431 RepID=A0ABZ1N284_9NOCA